MSIRKPLARRTLLRNSGIAIGLPLLEAMAPIGKTAFAQAQKPTRFVAAYAPCGFLQSEFIPNDTGRNYNFKATTKPMERYRDDILVIRNATNQAQHPRGDQGAHAHGTGAFLTGTKLDTRYKSSAKQAPSVDQVIAGKLPRETPIKSLHLSAEQMSVSASAGCDTGWACAYVYHISWTEQNYYQPNLTDPVKVFNELFGSVGGNSGSSETNSTDQSVLDFVKDDINALKNKLGSSDKEKMDEYLTSIRDLELNLDLGESSGGSCSLGQSPERVSGTKSKRAEQVIDLMSDLTALALQCDATRIVTFMFDRGASTRKYDDQIAGHTLTHHKYSHHANLTDMKKKLAQIELWEMQRFAKLVDKLKNTNDASGSSLLDSSIVFFSSEVNEGQKHRNDDMPLIMAGKANGQLKTGQCINLANGRKDFCNIYESIIDMMGVKGYGAFGDYGGGKNSDIYV